MKKTILLITILVLFFIQNIVFSRFPIMNVTLPLIYTFGLVASIYGDEWDAIFLGLCVGFLMDSYSPRLFGLNMFLNMNLFLGAKLISNYLRKEKLLIMSFYTAIVALLSNLVAYGSYLMFGHFSDLKSIFVTSVLVLLLTVPMIILNRKINKLQVVKRSVR